jgi:hypothetical protein
MKSNLWLTLLMVAALMLAMSAVVACGDDDDDDDDDDNDDDDAGDDDDNDTAGDDDDDDASDVYNDCVAFYTDCAFEDAETYCDGLQNLDLTDSCWENAVADFFDCLNGTSCDFGAIAACSVEYGAAIQDCL